MSGNDIDNRSSPSSIPPSPSCSIRWSRRLSSDGSGQRCGLGILPARWRRVGVSNHSGGLLTPDVLVLGRPSTTSSIRRPLYTLAHYGVFFTPFADTGRIGVIHASGKRCEGIALGRGRAGVSRRDYDAYRPTLSQTSSTSAAAPDTSGSHRSRRADRACSVDRAQETNCS